MHPNINPISNFLRILKSKVDEWIVSIVDDQGRSKQQKQQVDPQGKSAVVLARNFICSAFFWKDLIPRDAE
jgi:hypothetical protein